MTTQRISTKDAPAIRRQLRTLTQATDGGDTLKQGDEGPAVLALQKQLAASGHFKGPFTGYFGPITEAALKAFEKQHGHTVNGVLGAQNVKALKADTLFVEDGFKTPATVGQKGKDIASAERRLEALGFEAGAVDGKMDAHTAGAVKAFRRSRADLPDGSGVLDAQVNRALNQALSLKDAEADLATLGFSPGAVDGRETAQTGAALKAFQKQQGLRQTGTLDATTDRRLDDKAAAKATTGAKPSGTAAKAAWYQALVKKNGGTWRTGTNQVNIVGLRGQDVNGKRHGNAFNQWNDTLAYVWKGTDGKMHVKEFRATTDPGQKSGDGRDVNGDGRPDIAHLRPGSYPYHLGSHHGVYGAGNPGYNLQVDRDTNHDGRISAAERKASQRRDDRGFGINIHWGDGSVVGGWSLGCQVIKGSQDHFRRNVTPLMEMNRGQMYYTLVDQTR